MPALEPRGFNRSVPASSYFPSWLRDEFRKRLELWPLVFAPKTLSVVLHLRRSDLERHDTRVTPDEYYYRVVRDIQGLSSNRAMEVHVWSSTQNNPFFRGKHWAFQDFDGYRQRNMTVHLDEEINSSRALLNAWAHMARADVFVMSQSSFSIVPAYMNTNCVIYPSNIDAPLENWIDGSKNRSSSYVRRLQQCLERAERRLKSEAGGADQEVRWMKAKKQHPSAPEPQRL